MVEFVCLFNLIVEKRKKYTMYIIVELMFVHHKIVNQTTIQIKDKELNIEVNNIQISKANVCLPWNNESGNSQ